MDFSFVGFEPILPGWLLIVTGLISIGVGWWSYAKFSSFSNYYRVALIFLRSTVFFVLFVLLLNPLFETEKTLLQKPEIIYLLDNSRSTVISKGNYNGLDSYQNVLNSMNLADTDDLGINSQVYAFDVETAPSTLDSLTFSGSSTNLYRAIEVIKDKGQDIKAAVMVSDGIFTRGRNPSFFASNQQVPIFTIGLGDTSTVRDIIIKDIVTNSTGYTNTRHPVEVSVLNQGFPDTPLSVSILSDGETIARKQLTTNANTSTHTVNFELNLQNEGLRQYEIQVSSMPEEWSTENNSRLFNIDVIDNKIHILHLSFEIHPDVKAIRNVLRTDKSLQVRSRDYLSGNRFLGGKLPQEPDSLDLVILHGYNEGQIPASVEQKVEDLVANTATLFIQTPQSQFARSRETIQQRLPAMVQGSGSFNPVSMVQAIKKQQHPILELPEITYNRLPLVFGPVRSTQTKPGSVTLYTASFRGINTNAPLLSVMERGNSRSAYLLFYNLFKWQQSSDSDVRGYFKNLILNTVGWTSTRPDDQRLKVIPADNSITSDGSITLNAFLKNESNELEDEGTIDISLRSENMDPRFYTMENKGRGRYTLTLENLPKNLYTFEAEAQKNGRTIDVKTGEFSINETNDELIDTRRNDQLLSQIAKSTGGHYLPFTEADSLYSLMNQQNLLEKSELTISNSIYPFQNPFWFILVIILLTSEWAIRKYLALP